MGKRKDDGRLRIIVRGHAFYVSDGKEPPMRGCGPFWSREEAEKALAAMLAERAKGGK